MYVILSVCKTTNLGLKPWCVKLLHEAFYILLRLENLYTYQSAVINVISPVFASEMQNGHYM